MIRRALCVLTLVLWTTCAEQPARAADTEAVTARHDPELAIGVISSQPSGVISKYQGLAHYLEDQLEKQGIETVRVRVVPSLDRMAEALRAGNVDLFMDSFFSALLISELADSTIVLRRWQLGAAEYHSVIFTRAGSDIDSLEDLRGRIIAFESPFSTASYILPKATLMAAGLSLERQFDVGSVVPDNRVGFLFSGDDRNTATWVWRDRVDAGAINDIQFEALPDAQRERLKVITETAPVPNQLVSFRKDLDPGLAGQLIEILTDMESTEAGIDVLDGFDRTERFDLLPTASQAELNQLEQLTSFIHDDLRE
ncbi:MAG: phosphate/phosphite/phosphonate ABC transporter substrate-binding protein [Leptospirillia bacterium]